MRETLRLDEALAKAERGAVGEVVGEVVGVPGALEYGILDARVLQDLEGVEPIETVEGLIAEVSHLVERVERWTDVERVLDGISRLHRDRPRISRRRRRRWRRGYGAPSN